MKKPVTLKPLGIKDESFSAISKKVYVAKKSSKASSAHKRGATAVKGRKPLNDITNKSAIRHETPSGRKNRRKSIVEDDEYSEAVLPKFRRNAVLNNIAEEGFLHDHSKCVEAQEESVTEIDFLNTVLPGRHHHDSESLMMIVEEEEKMNQLKELSMEEEEEEELMLMRCWKSPPSSPELCSSSPPLPDFISELQVFELHLKEDDD